MSVKVEKDIKKTVSVSDKKDVQSIISSKIKKQNKIIRKEKKKELLEKKSDLFAGQAILKNGKISPRKISLMVDAIRGKKVTSAKSILTTFAYKKSAVILEKLLKSAIYNAINNNKYREENINDCLIDAWVGKGMILKRIEPRARGSSNRIEKVYSHVWLNLRKEVK